MSEGAIYELESEHRRRELESEIAKEERYQRFLKGRALSRIRWTPKQWAFMQDEAEDGSGPHEIMIHGPNQSGKSWCICGKMAIHLTGLYPPGWTGRRWDHPIVGAIGGRTAATTRDHLTDRLLGKISDRGSGFIPANCFDPKRDIAPGAGQLRGTIDYFEVDHWNWRTGKIDGRSRCYVFSYGAGWERLAGYTLHEIACDEEMDFEVYDELSARLLATEGYFSLSMTPQEGETELWRHFESRNGVSHKMIHYDLDDMEWASDEHKQRRRDKYRDHPMADARLHGLPVRGRGLLYLTEDSRLITDDFPIPPSWPRLIGLDLPHGIGYFAATSWAWNPQDDVAYCVATYKDSGKESPIYASRVIAMGGDRIPCAWPHDGGAAWGDCGGVPAAERYRQLGLNMLRDHAHFETQEGDSKSKYEAIERVIDRMSTGRLKVFRSASALLDEKRSYRHKDGKVANNQDDHLIDSMHKAIMMERWRDVPMLRGVREAETRSRLRERLGGYEFFGG